MKSRATFAKRDVLVVSGCLVFVLASLGAVGGGGRRRAKEAVCVSNLRRWGVIWKAFVDDEVRDRVSGSLISSAGFFMDRADAVWWLKTMIENYPASQERKLWVCPEATKVGSYPYYQRPEGALNPHAAWDDEIDWVTIGGVTYENYYVKGSYVINLWVSNYDDGHYWRTPYVRGAEDAPLVLDGQWKDMEPFPTDAPLPYEQSWWSLNTHEMQRACISRHNGAVNALFLDFSVRKVGLKELWTLKWNRTFDTEGPWTPAGGMQPEDWPEWMQNFREP
ncbi:MAG: hypothetical protein ACYTEQ_20900 [Planctomycetota bacterium]